MKTKYKKITYGKGGFTWKSLYQMKGVYIIAEEIDDVYYARYVGQGIIEDNMEKHESQKRETNECLKKFMGNRELKKTVFYNEIRNDKKRDDAEFTIWKFYGGKNNKRLCNENTPPGELDITVKAPFEDDVDIF